MKALFFAILAAMIVGCQGASDKNKQDIQDLRERVLWLERLSKEQSNMDLYREKCNTLAEVQSLQSSVNRVGQVYLPQKDKAERVSKCVIYEIIEGNHWFADMVYMDFIDDKISNAKARLYDKLNRDQK